MSQISFNIFSLFFFLFSAQLDCFLLSCFPAHWPILHSLVCCWFPLVYFKFHLFSCSSLIPFLHILHFNSYSHWCLHSFSSSVSSVTITFNILSGISPISVALCSILSSRTYSSVFPFCLTLCVCFYVLGRSATSSSLEKNSNKVMLCWRTSVVPYSTMSPDQQCCLVAEQDWVEAT